MPKLNNLRKERNTLCLESKSIAARPHHIIRENTYAEWVFILFRPRLAVSIIYSCKLDSERPMKAMVFRRYGKEYCGGSALEVVNALKREAYQKDEHECSQTSNT
jgi:hypothetical protein